MFVSDICCKCGIQFSMPEEFRKYRKQDKGTFYCPNGHPQHFTEHLEAKLKATEEELVRVKQRLAQKDAEINDAHAETEKIRKEAARIRKRIDAGVCPCCNRTFQNLARHMKAKHPQQAKPKAVSLA